MKKNMEKNLINQIPKADIDINKISNNIQIVNHMYYNEKTVSYKFEV